MLELATRVERILGVLGLSLGEKDKDNKKDDNTPAPTLSAQLKEIKEVVNAFAALFTAANNPDKAAEIVKPTTKDGVQWLEIFRTAQALVRTFALSPGYHPDPDAGRWRRSSCTARHQKKCCRSRSSC